MKVEVRLFSFLCNLIGKEENRCFFRMEMEKGTTCNDLLKVLNIPTHIPLLILVNGTVKEMNYFLEEGDEVSILPPIEGG